MARSVIIQWAQFFDISPMRVPGSNPNDFRCVAMRRASAIVCAQLFLLPLLAHLQGMPGVHDVRKARLTVPLEANGPRAHYMRARLVHGSEVLGIAPMGQQDSALLSILTEADALLIRPVGDGPRRTGDLVDYLPI